uniref:Tetratricopeptide repeat protein n=1 Tax=Desulfobacca acetoxidans TaxID=60893 RepID=A0A7V6A5Z7_9BACT
MLKTFALILLVLSLALFSGSCAVHRAEAPAIKPPEEEADCSIPVLQDELARLEHALKGPGEGRVNDLLRVARLSFLLGELSPKEEKSRYFEKGEHYSQLLLREKPYGVEGHYWLALNLCGLAEQGGARRGLKMVPEIVEELEKALKENPAYDQAGPHRVLGRIYFECPSWPLSVGNIPQAYSHLSAAVAIAPENSTNHLFLAEALFKMGKTEEARQELQMVLNGTRNALCRKFLEEDRQEALRLLQKK